MFVTITVKAEAESKDELASTFALQVGVLREHFDGLKQEGVFGDPAQVELRYLVIGGKTHESKPIIEEPVHGVPDVQ